MSQVGNGAGGGLPRQRGNVKWFSSQKGYGFVEPSVDGKDVFLHISCLPYGVDSLKDGQPVSFILDNTRKGPRATNVQLESSDAT